MIAITFGPRLERGQIRPGPRLRIALTPPVLGRQDTRQHLFLLAIITELLDYRAKHGEAKRHDPRRVKAVAFDLKDMALYRSPPGAAIFLRPCRREPPLSRQNAMPFLHQISSQLAPGTHRRGDVIGQVRLQELAHFLLEGDFLR